MLIRYRFTATAFTVIATYRDHDAEVAHAVTRRDCKASRPDMTTTSLLRAKDPMNVSSSQPRPMNARYVWPLHDPASPRANAVGVATN
jgi:hypothetical protein